MKLTFADRYRPALPLLLVLLVLLLGSAIPLGYPANADAPRRPARIFVLMIWDGLRPDFVTAAQTPNLFAMENEGVRFARHHALYPTITMVNAATLATGGYPGGTTILGDRLYLAPRLNAMKIAPSPSDPWASRVVDVENSILLAALNGQKAFNGALLGFEAIGQQVQRAGGYVAIVGKRGPTFMFDDGVSGEPAAGTLIGRPNYLFVSDDLVAPASIKSQLAPLPPVSAAEKILSGMRDTYLTRIVAERALPQAKAAALGGHPALVVFWQRNPDVTQHHRGLGTQAALDALKMGDADLATIRHAIAGLGIADRTDLMVVSDHGFATIRANVPLAQLLIAAGLKRSASSDDIVVASNGGTDLVYLSHTAFPTMEAQRAILQKITDFVESQPWAGSLFTRSVDEERARAGSPAENPGPNIESPNDHGLGWIKGTFGFDTAALIDRASRFGAPDLVVSFRELSDADNRGLTGPDKPVYVVGLHGEQNSGGANHSDPLVTPIKGLIYSDTGNGGAYTSGMGMHAAAGVRELHNFCAAVGPDFRRHFVDQYPSGNIDVRTTIALALGLAPDQAGKDGLPLSYAGRPLDEALTDRQLKATVNESALTVSRTLPTMEAATTLRFSVLRAGPRRWSYLDDAEYKDTPLKESK